MNKVLLIIIFILVGIIFINYENKNNIKTITRVIDKPQIIKVDTVYLKIPAKVDTQYIIKKYYSKINYKRQYSDNNIDINLNDTIIYNNLVNGSLQYTLRQDTKLHYYTQINYDLKNNIGFGLMVMKNRFGYSLNYYPNSKNINIGILYKLR